MADATHPLPPWREPARGGYPTPETFARPGPEQLEDMMAGRSPLPPVARLTGMRLVEFGSGYAIQEMPLTRWLCSPQGVIPLGALVVPADAAMAGAIISSLPTGVPFTTWELSFRSLSPASPGGSAIARGNLIQLRRQIVLAEVSVTDEHGRLLAHGSSLCFLMPDAPAPEPAQPDTRPPAAPTDDPPMRPPLGEIIPQAEWDRLSGLEILRGQLRGDLPQSPLHHLTGLEITAVAAGEASFSLPATEWLCAPPRDRAQGGTIALLCDTALGSAIQTTLPAGTALAPVDFKINYLRPLRTDGRRATATATVLHTGRRFALARAEARDADGRTAAIATGSAMILPGRPAALRDGPVQ